MDEYKRIVTGYDPSKESKADIPEEHEDPEMTFDELKAKFDVLHDLFADEVRALKRCEAILEETEAAALYFKNAHEQRERELECAHSRIRAMKRCQRYDIKFHGKSVKMVENRFGKWIMHDEMVAAAALPHPDDDNSDDNITYEDGSVL